jgi:hypothetical protein
MKNVKTFTVSLFVALSMAPTTWATDRYVNPDGVCGGNSPCYMTIGGALAVSVGGDVIHVAAATYPENVSMSVPVTLLGAQAGVDARGRVASESIVSSVSAATATLNIACSGTVTVDGFSFSGGPTGSNGVIFTSAGPNNGMQIVNNRFSGYPSAAVWMNRGGSDITIDKNVMDGSNIAPGSIAQAIFCNGPQSYVGLFITNNWVVNNANRYGVFVDGNHNVGESASRAPSISGNLFDKNVQGLNLGSRSFGTLGAPTLGAYGGTISNNTFSNHTANGIQAGIQHVLVSRNIFTNNAVSGLALTSFGNTGADRGAQNCTITENFFSGNGSTSTPAAPQADVFFSATQGVGTMATNHVNGNSFASALPGYAVAFSGTEATVIDCSSNWWGSATGPTLATHPSGTGKSIGGTHSEKIDFTPWLNVSTDTNLGTAGFQGSFSTLHVDDDSPQFGSTGRVQEGVNLVTASTVIVHPGLYEEQVVINMNNLVLQGSGSGNNSAVDSIIRSPVCLPYSFNTGVDNHPIIGIHDCTGVSIKNIRVDGFGRGNACGSPLNYRFEGIAYYNAGGSVEQSYVTSIRETPINGNQHGVAIYANNNTGGPYTLDVSDTTVIDYQKNGFALSGEGLTANVTRCTSTGAGPVNFIAQNGIQIGFGAGGSVTDCIVSGHQYTPATAASVGVLLYQATDTSVTGSTITNNLPGIYAIDTDATIDENSVVNNTASGTGDAIDVLKDTVSLLLMANPSQSGRVRPQPMDESQQTLNQDSNRPARLALGGGDDRAITTVTISNNKLTGGDFANTAGVYAFATVAGLNVDAHSNKVRDWDLGLVADEGSGGPVVLTAHSNIIASNVTDGYFATGPTVQNAKNNFWNAATGPYDPTGSNEAGSPPCFSPSTMKNSEPAGDAVTDLYVDYCPWSTGSGSLTLEASDTCIQNGQTQITVELWMRNLSQSVTGFQAFVEFDDTKFSLLSAPTSSYTASPFPLHLRNFTPGPSYVQTSAGHLSLDGSVTFGGAAVSGDFQLATLRFSVLPAGWTECETTNLVFVDSPPFLTELSLNGAGIPTCKIDSPVIRRDTIAPVLSSCPISEITVECDAVPAPAMVTATDNCDASVTVSYLQVRTDGICPDTYTLTRTWSAADSCTNASSCSQTIHVQDTTAPLISCPPDVTVECGLPTDPDSLGTTLTFDTNPTLSSTQASGVWYTDRYAPAGFVSAFFGGDNRLKHSIDATDAQSPANQFYNTQGRKYDVPGTTRMSIQLYVPGDWATTGRRMAGFWGTGFNAINNVSSFPIIEFTSNSEGSGLPRFRGWNNAGAGSWVDMGLPTGFGYNAWYTLQIELVGTTWVYTVGDLHLATTAVDVVEGASVKIGNVILQGHNTTAGVTYDIYWDNFVAAQTALATDNCDNLPTITYSDNTSGMTGCDNTGTIVRTWRATDNCGNSSTCPQTITVVDNIDPVLFGCPGDTTVACNAVPAPAVVTATDNCDPSPAVILVETSTQSGDLESCAHYTYSITRTWTATDDCGNDSSCVQTITVQDTSDPVITCPANISVNADPGGCSASPNPGTASASDNCDGSPTILGTRSDLLALNDPYPTGLTTITWTATDACGNSDTCPQTVTVASVNSFKIPVELHGVVLGGSQSRCIRFVLKDTSTCNATTISVSVTFNGGVASPGIGATGLAEFSVACSPTGWLSICGKDEQHTLSDKQLLGTAGGPPHYTSAPLVLLGGDTDNDNDVDINEVTWLLFQYGGAVGVGGCPWDGTRDADFSLNSAIGAEDYLFISENWLKFRNCCSPMGWPLLGSDDPDARPDVIVESEQDLAAIAPSARTSVSTSELNAEVAQRADLNSDGVIDYRDVQAFEDQMGLTRDLSSKMQPMKKPSLSDGGAAPATKR